MSEEGYSNAIVKVEQKFLDVSNRITYEKEKSYAVQIFQKNPYLQKATYNSVVNAMVNVANIGLTLNPALKLAYLVPRYNGQTRSLEVCLEPSYQGLVKLITDTGSARSVYCHIVYEGDEFNLSLGTNQEIEHKPKFPRGTDIKAVYAIAVLADSSKQIEVMDINEVNNIRSRSESYKQWEKDNKKRGVWIQDYGEMCRKTVIRRLCKYLPKTEQWNKLSEAIKLDESDYTNQPWQMDKIEMLIRTAAIPPQNKELIEREMYQYTFDEANLCINHLNDSQVDPISAGNNYGAGDITKKLKTET